MDAESMGATMGAMEGEVVQQSVPSASGESCQEMTNGPKKTDPELKTAFNPEPFENEQVTPTGLEPVLPA